MSKLSDLLIEAQETGMRASLPQSQTASETSPTQSHISSTYAMYWRLCLDVISAAGEVAGKDKLLMNFRDPSKRHSVKNVVEQSFGGEKGNIISKRNDNIRIFFAYVDRLNEYSVKYGFDQVCGMELMGILVDAKTRGKFRHHTKKHIKSSHPPFALDELPARDFRKTLG